MKTQTQKGQRAISVKSRLTLLVRIGSLEEELTIAEARSLSMALQRHFITIQPDEKATIGHVQQIVAGYFQVDLKWITGRTRDARAVWARHVAMVIAREMLPLLTLTDIGNAFARDHATILHAAQAVRAQLDVSEKARKEVAEVRARVSAAVEKTTP